MSKSEPVAWLSKVLKGSLAGTIGLASPESKLNPELFEGPFPVFRHDHSEELENLRKGFAFVQKLLDAAGDQPSVATGYLRDILEVLRGEA